MEFLDELREKAKHIVSENPEKILRKLLKLFEDEIEEDWVVEKKDEIIKKHQGFVFSDIPLDIKCKFSLNRKRHPDQSGCGCHHCYLVNKYVNAKRAFKRLYGRDFNVSDEDVLNKALSEYKEAKFRSRIAKIIARYNNFKELYEEYKNLKKISHYSSFKQFLKYKYCPEVNDMFKPALEMYAWFFPNIYEADKELHFISDEHNILSKDLHEGVVVREVPTKPPSYYKISHI